MASGHAYSTYHCLRKLGLDTGAFRSLTKASLWGKYWVGFMTGGEVLSVRPLGFQRGHPRGDTGLVSRMQHSGLLHQ